MAYSDVLYEKANGVEGRNAFVEKRPVDFGKFRS